MLNSQWGMGWKRKIKPAWKQPPEFHSVGVWIKLVLTHSYLFWAQTRGSEAQTLQLWHNTLCLFPAEILYIGMSNVKIKGGAAWVTPISPSPPPISHRDEHGPRGVFVGYSSPWHTEKRAMSALCTLTPGHRCSCGCRRTSCKSSCFEEQGDPDAQTKQRSLKIALIISLINLALKS